MNTINETLKLGLCVSCGICASTCSYDAIDLGFFRGQYIPVISDVCNNCGECLRICPGYRVKFGELYQYESRELPDDVFYGHVISSFVGYSKNEFIRKLSASGGMITTLIVQLIKDGLYEGAFVLPFETISSERIKIMYEKATDKIIAASKSKYLPASVENVVLELEHLEAPIIVGTPCQIHGIKQFCMEKAIDYSHVLFLGLFCEKTLNYNLIDYYQWKYGKRKAIQSFDYRNKENGGWPGHTKITFNDAEVKFVDHNVRMSLKRYFQLERCLYCVDKLNQLADISFGDCYIIGEKTFLGQSNILVRTTKGEKALLAAKDKLALKHVEVSEIASSQKIEEKQINLIFCSLLYSKHKHIIYPDFQEKAIVHLSSGNIYEELRRALKLLDLGREPLNYTKIQNMLAREKIIKSVLKIGMLIVKNQWGKKVPK